jgi:SPP1 family predicted phage head-tail adaptor
MSQRAAGNRNQLVTIEAPSQSTDGLGQRVETWAAITDGTDIWAAALPIRGREFFAAGTMQNETTVRFVIDYRADVTYAMRVVWNGVPHAIVGEPINVNGMNHTLELMCAAGGRDTRT